MGKGIEEREHRRAKEVEPKIEENENINYYLYFIINLVIYLFFFFRDI